MAAKTKDQAAASKEKAVRAPSKEVQEAHQESLGVPADAPEPPKQTVDVAGIVEANPDVFGHNPAWEMDQVEQAEEARAANEQYRREQAARPDAKYAGDVTNHAAYMQNLDLNEADEKEAGGAKGVLKPDEATGTTAKEAKPAATKSKK